MKLTNKNISTTLIKLYVSILMPFKNAITISHRFIKEYINELHEFPEFKNICYDDLKQVLFDFKQKGLMQSMQKTLSHIEIVSIHPQFGTFFNSIIIDKITKKNIEKAFAGYYKLIAFAIINDLDSNNQKKTQNTLEFTKIELNNLKIALNFAQGKNERAFNRIFTAIIRYYQYKYSDLDIIHYCETIIKKSETSKTKKIKQNRIEAGGVYFSFAKAQRELGVFEEAEKNFLKSINFCGEKEIKYTTDCYYQLALLKKEKLNYTKAIDYIQQGLKIARKFEQKIKIGSFYNLWGVILERKNKIEEAKTFYSKGIDILNAIPDGITELESLYNNLGMLFFNQREYQKAEKIFKISLNINEKHPYRLYQKAMYYNNLGLANLALKNNKFAKQYFHKAIELYNYIKKTDNISQIYHNLGNLEYSERNLDATIEYYQLAIKFYKEESHKADVHYNLGIIFLKQKKYSVAYQYFLRTISIYEKYQVSTSFEIVYYQLGVTAYHLGNITDAIEYQKKSLQYSKTPHNKAVNQIELAQLYAKKDDYEKTKYYIKEALLSAKKSDSAETENKISEKIKFIQKQFNLEF